MATRAEILAEFHDFYDHFLVDALAETAAAEVDWTAGDYPAAIWHNMYSIRHHLTWSHGIITLLDALLLTDVDEILLEALKSANKDVDAVLEDYDGGT